jgi:predicted amidophosphoribosyltransferase
MRLLSRRYNQSALLSRLFAREHGIVHTAELLERTKNTPPQQGNLSKRFKNVRGVFKVGPKHKDTIKNKTILLIDDVYTTGSTAENCARCLKKAGAAKVYVLTVFRVISPQNPK